LIPLALLVILGGLAFYWKTRQAAKTGSTAISVPVVPVAGGDVQRSVRVTGTVAARNFAALLAQRVLGSRSNVNRGGMGGGGLAGPGGYFAETIPLEKMKFKGLLLFCRNFSSKPVQQCPTRNLVYRYLPPGRRRPLFVELLNAVVMTNIQVSSAVDCSLVGHLNDPRCP